MKGAKPATKQQTRRMQLLKQLGCLPCRIDGRGAVLAEAHHLNAGGVHGGRRRGHDQTIALCSWHHQGTCREGWTVAQMTKAYGPSWAHQPTRFSQHYGDDDRLLDYQNHVLSMVIWQ